MTEPTVANKHLIEQIFDGAAEQYDRAGPAIFRKLGTRMVDLVGIAPGMHVLDVATGSGAVLIAAAQRVGPSGQVIGVDLSNEMLGQADAAVRALGLSNVQLGRMDAESLEFPDGSFDAVTCAFSIFLFPSMEAALREMHRVCRPGGRLGISVWSKTPPPFDPAWKLFADQVRKYGVEVRMPQRVAYAPQDVENMVRAAGFADIQLTTETKEIVYPNEEDWWSFQLTNGSRAAILRMPEETRSKFKEEYLAQLRLLFRADGLHLPAAAIYAVASRQQTFHSQQ
jgi:O-methyltransferase/aklanonic acid methyltransferase